MTLGELRCRSCYGDALEPVLSLGRTPLANGLLRKSELAKPEPRFELDLVFCPNCSLIQITQTVSPETLFTNYVYFSSYSDTMVRHAAELARELVAKRKLGPTSLVIEVASNDGYLLQFYKTAEVPVLGIEPAMNIASVAQRRGVDTLIRFFGHGLAEDLRAQGLRADVIHANNVLAHVADLNGFVSGLALVLKANGIAVIEVPHVWRLIERLEFDTIYHEHLSYFSLSALIPLFERNGLTVTDVVELPLHGGSLQVHAAIEGQSSDSVKELVEAERRAGLHQLPFYRDFGARILNLRNELQDMLRNLRSSGNRIAAYGASAKGSTLLNFCNIGQETLDFVADRSIEKQGLYTPGTHIPIVPPEALLNYQPDYVLMLAWNFADEILEQQIAYRKRGGRFIVPVPEPKII